MHWHTPSHPHLPYFLPYAGMEYAESRQSYLRHILVTLKAGAVGLYEAGYQLAAFMAWQQYQVGGGRGRGEKDGGRLRGLVHLLIGGCGAGVMLSGLALGSCCPRRGIVE